MQILYTGAVKQGVEQLDPNLSLGGHVSGSIIPNGQLSNLFSQASAISIQNKRRETKMIALYNNDGDILTNISLKFTLEANSICKYKIAFVAPTISSNGPCFEQIDNSNVLPYYATFQDIVSEGVIVTPDLTTGSYLGMWLVKEYDFSADELKSKTCTDWLALSDNPQELDQEELLTLTVDYTVGDPSVSISNSTSNSTSVSI